MEQKREIWVGDVKVIACVLVVLGHFFQSMTAEIMKKTRVLEFFLYLGKFVKIK